MIYRFDTTIPDTILEIDSLDNDQLLTIITHDNDLSVQVTNEVLYDLIGTLLKMQGLRNFKKEVTNG